MRIRGTGHSDTGMTLTELLFASSVLLVCLIGLAAMLGGSATSASVARVRDEATNLANERLEIARSMRYDRVGTHNAEGVYGDPAGDILTPEWVGKFAVNTECQWIRNAEGRSTYKRVTVRVSWADPVPGRVEVNTIIYGKSDMAASGDFIVRLRYREDAAPVGATAVSLRMVDGSTRTVSTDAEGEAFFGQAPVGACTVMVTPPTGCIVDTSTATGTAVSADAVSTAIVYIQRPADAVIRVRDMNGTPIENADVQMRRVDGTIVPLRKTDAAGGTHFVGLLYGDYSATVSKAGFASASLPFSVSVGSPSANVNFTMSPAPTLGMQVRVFDSNGTRIPGATVAIQRSGSTTIERQGVTGTNGEIAFTPTYEGDYVVTTSRSDYATQAKTVTVSVAAPVAVDFLMSAVATQGNMHLVTLAKNKKPASLRVVVSGPGGYYANNLWSDASGDLWLYDLVQGSYSVRMYTDTENAVTVIVTAGQTTDATISQK